MFHCSIIAVGYEARAFGVTRNLMGDDAQKICPDIILVRVPEARGKADLTRYVFIVIISIMLLFFIYKIFLSY